MRACHDNTADQPGHRSGSADAHSPTLPPVPANPQETGSHEASLNRLEGVPFLR